MLRHEFGRLLRAALSAVDPTLLVRRALATPSVRALLEAAHAVDVIAAGKCADGMLAALDGRVSCRRVVRVGVADAGHPVPDARSVAAGEAALALAREAETRDLLLVLLSGGASSLLALPAARITLNDKRETVRQLLRAGASIGEVNAVRKHLSTIKGGQLADATHATILTLAISDVVGDDPAVIASGPTTPDPSTFGSALHVLASYGGYEAFPAGVVARLRRGTAGDLPETPKPGSAAFRKASMHVVGRLGDAIDGAARAAADRGYRVHVVPDAIIGEARDAARLLVATALTARRQPDDRLCVLAGGETTVTVRGAGRGGRNQELALAMVPLISSLGHHVLAASVGTDGIDGPTDAAGAIVDGSTARRAQTAGLELDAHLNDNNSYAFFDAIGDLVRTGPTGTNVGDLQIILIGGAET
jgi:glycerate 2-kinase